MAQITVSTGLWSTLRGYINTMFTELYAEHTSQYRVFTSGGYTFREGVRSGEFVLDQEITPTGFSGTENYDWANIRHEALP